MSRVGSFAHAWFPEMERCSLMVVVLCAEGRYRFFFLSLPSFVRLKWISQMKILLVKDKWMKHWSVTSSSIAHRTAWTWRLKRASQSHWLFFSILNRSLSCHSCVCNHFSRRILLFLLDNISTFSLLLFSPSSLEYNHYMCFAKFVRCSEIII